MEPVTHFLTGAVLARTGFNRKTALATAAMTLAAEAADLDVFWRFHGSVGAFAAHRGITHTVWAIPFLAALVTGFLCFWRKMWSRVRPPMGGVHEKPVRWELIFGYSCIAALTHLWLDYTNNYGVRAFWPLDKTWRALDIVYIVEPVMLVILLAALLLPALLGLVSDEVGARSRNPRGRGMACLAIVMLICLWSYRGIEHHKAIQMIEGASFDGQSAVRVAAFPTHTNPWLWDGLVETKGFYKRVSIDTRSGRVEDPGPQTLLYKPEETAITQAARQTYTGRVYLGWARFPLLETQPSTDPAKGPTVCFHDMRFDAGIARSRGILQACVDFDPQSHVADEGFRRADGRLH